MSFFNKLKIKPLFNLLLPYILLFIVPLIYLVFFYNNMYLSVITEDISKNQLNSLTTIKDTIDNEFVQIYNIHTNLQFDTTLKPLKSPDEPTYARDIIQELKSYSVSNTFFTSIAIYYMDNNYLYTNSSSCELDLFFSYFL